MTWQLTLFNWICLYKYFT